MINVLGIPEPAGIPLAHLSRALPVDTWTLQSSAA